MTSTPPSVPPRASRLPLLFACGIILFGLWAAWLSWVVLAAAVAVALVPARTYASDVRAWARRQGRRG